MVHYTIKSGKQTCDNLPAMGTLYVTLEGTKAKHIFYFTQD